MDSNFKGTIVTFGIFVIIAVIAVSFLGVKPSQQSAALLPEMSEHKEEAMKDEILTTPKENKNIILPSEMNCDELRDFILSFENGWGKAMAEFGSRCSDNSSN